MNELNEMFELLHFMMDEKTKEVESVEEIVKLVRRYQTVCIQWAKSPKKSLKECVFVNSSLKLHCHFVKNTLIQTAFSAIFIMGRVVA